MKNDVVKNFGCKLAERNHHSYYFYPYVFYRLAGWLLLFNCSLIAITIYYLMNFETTPYFYLYVFVYVFISAFFITISYKSIQIADKGASIAIKTIFSTKTIELKNVRNILRLTQQKKEYGTFQTLTVFYLTLIDDSKIKLSPDLVNVIYNSQKKIVLDKFDNMILLDLTNDLYLPLIKREKELGG